MCGAETDGATDGGAGQGAAKLHTSSLPTADFRSRPMKYLSTQSMVSHLVQQANKSLFGVCCAVL